MLERMLRDVQTIKIDVKTLIQDLNNTKLTEFEQLDGQLNFQDYQDLQSFNEKLTEEDYFNKMVIIIKNLNDFCFDFLLKMYFCIAKGYRRKNWV